MTLSIASFNYNRNKIIPSTICCLMTFKAVNSFNLRGVKKSNFPTMETAVYIRPTLCFGILTVLSLHDETIAFFQQFTVPWNCQVTILTPINRRWRFSRQGRFWENRPIETMERVGSDWRGAIVAKRWTHETPLGKLALRARSGASLHNILYAVLYEIFTFVDLLSRPIEKKGYRQVKLVGKKKRKFQKIVFFSAKG